MNLDGYKEYKGGVAHKDSDKYFAKSFKDNIGKKYQIVFYYYDWTKYPHYNGSHPDSYMPEIYFRLSDDVSVFHTFAGYNSVEYVEEYAEKMWVFLGRPYLDTYE
jgi:hypothetical protein